MSAMGPPSTTSARGKPGPPAPACPPLQHHSLVAQPSFSAHLMTPPRSEERQVLNPQAQPGPTQVQRPPADHPPHCDSPGGHTPEGLPQALHSACPRSQGSAPSPCVPCQWGPSTLLGISGKQENRGCLLPSLGPCRSANGLCGCFIVKGTFRRDRLKGLAAKFPSVPM